MAYQALTTGTKCEAATLADVPGYFTKVINQLCTTSTGYKFHCKNLTVHLNAIGDRYSVTVSIDDIVLDQQQLIATLHKLGITQFQPFLESVEVRKQRVSLLLPQLGGKIYTEDTTRNMRLYANDAVYFFTALCVKFNKLP